jgi:3-hydroxyisobutyrate dehydrogenase-like beta-hydroxyacid dehydrogenase
LKPIVAIVAQGTMGAGLAARLTARGVQVLTSLLGRSAESRARAEAAGMRAVDVQGLMDSQFLLSILPPASALPFAQSLAPTLRSAAQRPVFVDCNAVSPKTLQSIADSLGDTGVRFVDVGIIGLPPREDYAGPCLYAAGAGAGELTVLNEYGLNVRCLEGPIGTASALKMAYAGITKGLIAVASSMIINAERAGVADALKRELASSAPALLASLSRGVPDMLPKAYRWVAEMQQIQDFAGSDSAARALYEGAEHLYQRFASGMSEESDEINALLHFFGQGDRAPRI